MKKETKAAPVIEYFIDKRYPENTAMVFGLIPSVSSFAEAQDCRVRHLVGVDVATGLEVSCVEIKSKEKIKTEKREKAAFDKWEREKEPYQRGHAAGRKEIIQELEWEKDNEPTKVTVGMFIVGLLVAGLIGAAVFSIYG